MDYQQIMMQQASKSLNEPTYCRYCGKDIKGPTAQSKQSEKGYASQWELQNNAHQSCYQKHYYGGNRR